MPATITRTQSSLASGSLDSVSTAPSVPDTVDPAAGWAQAIATDWALPSGAPSTSLAKGSAANCACTAAETACPLGESRTTSASLFWPIMYVVNTAVAPAPTVRTPPDSGFIVPLLTPRPYSPGLAGFEKCGL